MALLVFTWDPMAPPMSPPRDPAVPCVFRPCFFLCRLLVEFLYVELRSPFSYDYLIFACILAEVLIANTVAIVLVRPVNSLHDMPFRFHLQAPLAAPPLARRLYSHRRSRFLCCLIARVRKHVMYLRHISRFCCHCQRLPLTRDPPHNCCGKHSLAGQ